MEFLSFVMPNLADPQIWVSLLTLTFLEVVLGVDNIIFVSILSDKLPAHQQKKARNIGLGFAMLFRVGLLFAISWLIGLNQSVLTLEWFDDPKLEGAPLSLSWKDIILLCGGLFLIVKSTMEIHHKMQADESEKKSQSKTSGLMAMVIAQIIMVDIVFSLDSILTAVGLVDNVAIMIIAVIISMSIMMMFAGTVSRVINAHPSLQMLALSFLVVIGVLLVAEGIHQHISKNIIYSCLAFSLTVELLNINLRQKQEKHKKLVANSEERNIED